jgi:hypothetical protein
MLFKVNVVLFTFDVLAGGIIALWKSVVITVKVEIGGAAAQIVLREVADKRRLYLVAKVIALAIENLYRQFAVCLCVFVCVCVKNMHR